MIAPAACATGASAGTGYMLPQMATAAQARLSVEEYLRGEREATSKSEYFAGAVFAMAGASREHNLIVTNLVGELRSRLRGTNCEVYPSDMRVAVSTGFYTYPDVSVAGGPSFLDARQDTLLDPVLLAEVLSPTTEAYDRGRKFEQYRALLSLREYLLISPVEARIERFRRSAEGWLLDETVGLDAALRLTSVEAELPMSEVYALVELPAQPSLR